MPGSFYGSSTRSCASRGECATEERLALVVGREHELKSRNRETRFSMAGATLSRASGVLRMHTKCEQIPLG